MTITTADHTMFEKFKLAQVHQCCEQLNSELPPVAYQIITMTDSLFIWVGQGDDAVNSTSHSQDQQQSAVETGRLEQLAVAMLHGSQTISSTLLCPTLEGHSENIAKRLASRFKMQVFMSMGLGIMYEQTLPLIERRLHVLLREAIDSSASGSVSIQDTQHHSLAAKSESDHAKTLTTSETTTVSR
ncbi:hypothetical protein BATDEDRAFT_92473 [Batrachochytrium dendrobatidis JAM81]|uniref:Proteasome assembly chaperone 3 n=2 Tax=Batrachochytrium dendrobatidis TaxID=109871 RepID=F4PDI4_BATDJ|nr:uncharacterized protein BATDEDRAFT_92473 [Batrachochytrium dendrobatidis JAM81]EGF76684.1 hypothetical protein BATDEDRAFT_92473 [Batrachochytrium dendrobatidis JAM81]OAJ45226.1 hypothetical protein BDEG_28383 [Batrachochytrium dendrobatidis JEL423]|eukprot:XP_006682687.1 hypothetical protein BATDEDRAFT_92473 [Batrachochytrium dendrobatidis JAM81]